MGHRREDRSKCLFQTRTGQGRPGAQGGAARGYSSTEGPPAMTAGGGRARWPHSLCTGQSAALRRREASFPDVLFHFLVLKKKEWGREDCLLKHPVTVALSNQAFNVREQKRERERAAHAHNLPSLSPF